MVKSIGKKEAGEDRDTFLKSLTLYRLLHAFEASSVRFGGEFGLISHLKSVQKSSQYYAELTSKARRTQQGEKTGQKNLCHVPGT